MTISKTTRDILRFSVFSLLILLLVLCIASCGSPSDKTEVVTPVPVVESPLKQLGKFELPSGDLYLYQFNGDTIYLMEGKGSSYPVSMVIKK